MVAAAVALNVAVVAPAATVTDAGTVSKALLLASVTLDPPVGAVWVSVTAHVPTAPEFRFAALHVRLVTDAGTGHDWEIAMAFTAAAAGEFIVQVGAALEVVFSNDAAIRVFAPLASV